MTYVLRYTVLELARRRVLLAIGVAQVLLLIVFARREPTEILLADTFAAFFALVIGATAFRPELDSGAAAVVLSRPLGRQAYAAGKLAAAAAVMAGIFTVASLLALPLARLAGGNWGLLAGAMLTAAANGVLVLCVVLVLAIRLSGPVAALIGFVVFEAAGGLTVLHGASTSPLVTVVYRGMPHRLVAGAVDLPDLVVWALYLAVLGGLLVWAARRLEI